MEVLIGRPRVGAGVWIAPGAVVTGDCQLEDLTSVWFNATVRADLAPIRIGRRSNIQDACVLHVDKDHPCTLGADVTVGHGAIVHGATVEDNCLIGINATILSGARIGTGSVVGAGALVTENKVIPPGSLVVGVPGKVVRQLSDLERDQIRQSADHYARYAARYLAEYQP